MGKITLESLEAPYVLKESTYFWRTERHAAARRSREKYYVSLVEDWLRRLCEQHGLNLRIEKTDTSVAAYNKDEQVFKFTIRLSCRHVYKRQDVKKLLRLVSETQRKGGDGRPPAAGE